MKLYRAGKTIDMCPPPEGEELKAKLAAIFEAHRPARDAVIAQAKAYRLNQMRLIDSITDPSMRADALRHMGWTERTLDEVRVVLPIKGTTT